MPKSAFRARQPWAMVPLTIWLVFTLASVHVAVAATLPSTTTPNPDSYPTTWYFAGEKAVRLSAEKKGGEALGHFNAYALADAKLLWHAEQTLGHGTKDDGPMLVVDADHDHWYLGTGPLSRLDLATGAIQWTTPCDQLGFVQPAFARILAGNRLLLMGTKNCDPGTAYDALKEPQLTMVDAATGRILWQYETKSLEYKLSLGFWAKVAQYQGQQVSGEKRIQLDHFLASPGGGGYVFDAADPDRVVIAGERFEGVNLADGAPLFKSKDKPGILRGAYDGRVFFRDGDKVTGFDAGTGAELWTFDADSKGAYVYTVDDFASLNEGVPEDMHDIIISTGDKAFRVSTVTGKEAWAVKRGGMSWSTSQHAFMTESGDKITAYDWVSGAMMWEAKISSKPRPHDAGDFIIFAEGTATDNVTPMPPFKFTVVSGRTGQIIWAKKDIGGKKISEWMLLGDERIVLLNEAGAVATLNVADGTPAEAPTRLEDRFIVKYVERQDALQCHDHLGNLVWQREGESTLPGRKYLAAGGCVVWVSKDGVAEVINRADGATLWEAKGLKESQAYLNADGTYLVVQSKKDFSIVRLGT